MAEGCVKNQESRVGCGQALCRSGVSFWTDDDDNDDEVRLVTV